MRMMKKRDVNMVNICTQLVFGVERREFLETVNLNLL